MVAVLRVRACGVEGVNLREKYTQRLYIILAIYMQSNKIHKVF